MKELSSKLIFSVFEIAMISKSLSDLSCNKTSFRVSVWNPYSTGALCWRKQRNGGKRPHIK